MSAEFKSHILKRDEKGFAGVSFKRLLLAGTGGGLIFSVCRILAPDHALLWAGGGALALLILTATQGGLPLYLRLIYRLRGAALLLADRHPDGWFGRMAHALGLPVSLVQLDGARLFAGAHLSDSFHDLHEWVTFSHARERDGLHFVPAPLERHDG